jgi:hypothetical protein
LEDSNGLVELEIVAGSDAETKTITLKIQSKEDNAKAFNIPLINLISV